MVKLEMWDGVLSSDKLNAKSVSVEDRMIKLEAKFEILLIGR